jgi:hypothetical protein
MGIDIIRLNEGTTEREGALRAQDLAQLTCREYAIQNPEMYIWLMVAMRDRALFPWWQYDFRMEKEIQSLNELWSISTQQSLFDCLFLSMLKRFAGPNFFVLFPGNVKSDGWTKLRESDRSVFQRGQGCVYHLQGSFDSKLSINWVPFWQPQSMVRDPNFANLWRLFMASKSEDATASISFFSLSDPKKMAQVATLLIDQEEQRSEKLAQLVDWFGVYTSPQTEAYSPACVFYTGQKEQISRFTELQKTFTGLFEEAKKQLIAKPEPSTVLRLLSRHIPL